MPLIKEYSADWVATKNDPPIYTDYPEQKQSPKAGRRSQILRTPRCMV